MTRVRSARLGRSDSCSTDHRISSQIASGVSRMRQDAPFTSARPPTSCGVQLRDCYDEPGGASGRAPFPVEPRPIASRSIVNHRVISRLEEELSSSASTSRKAPHGPCRRTIIELRGCDHEGSLPATRALRAIQSACSARYAALQHHSGKQSGRTSLLRARSSNLPSVASPRATICWCRLVKVWARSRGARRSSSGRLAGPGEIILPTASARFPHARSHASRLVW